MQSLTAARFHPGSKLADLLKIIEWEYEQEFKMATEVKLKLTASASLFSRNCLFRDGVVFCKLPRQIRIADCISILAELMKSFFTRSS